MEQIGMEDGAASSVTTPLAASTTTSTTTPLVASTTTSTTTPLVASTTTTTTTPPPPRRRPSALSPTPRILEDGRDEQHKTSARLSNSHMPLSSSPLRATFTPDTAGTLNNGRVTQCPPMSSNGHVLNNEDSHGGRRPSTAPHISYSPPTIQGTQGTRDSYHPGVPTFADFHLAPVDASNTVSNSHSATSTLAQRRANATGAQSPLETRNVQFDQTNPQPHISLADIQHQIIADEAVEDDDVPSSFFGKLKATFTPTHSRRNSEYTNNNPTTPVITPREELEEPRYPLSNVDGSEAEADFEDSEEGDHAKQKLKKRKRRKDKSSKKPNSAPSTPRTPRFTAFLSRDRDRADHYFSPINADNSNPTDHVNPPAIFVRRATMSEIPEHARAGVSEDEGRDRLAKSAWRRGLHNARGLSYGHHRRPSERDAESPDARRPGLAGMRRITGLEGVSSPWRTRNDRQMSTSAQKWKQVKAGLQMLGRREKSKRQTVDHQKSAELMAELLAGSPAAIFFASMYQRDEHGRRKIPVLLEQLKISIPSSRIRESRGERHTVFTINLEYGNGPSRMSWTIHRSVRDFFNLHLKYKFQSRNERYNPLKKGDATGVKMPRFPRSAFPYLRGVRGYQDLEDEDDNDNAIAEHSGPDGDASATDRPAHRRRRPSSFAHPSRTKSSTGTPALDGTSTPALSVGDPNKGKDPYSDRQRRKLEIYLQQMIKWLIFRPDANRLCKFLELSSLGMRLAVEGGYHGKEGLLSVVNKPKIDFRRVGTSAPTLATLKFKHSPKWFLVRHSYLVAVDSPESLEVRECFLVDADFSLKRKQKSIREQSAQEMASRAAATAQPKHHLLKLYNSERKLKCLAKNERQLIQFKESIEQMQKNTIWSQRHRFDSFAPVRKNVFARWLVDGRDHMWQVSRAIDNAKSFIYIHDWWLSPELYMRRPAAISQKWRLDRLLMRKAQEGVKIFVIVYRNIESAIPIGSDYTKASLLDLHPNICVQRSPNQFRQNQFFWAHHEKLVVIDNQMAFVGGIDLCFGRWDDPNHSVTDDKLTGFELDMEGARNADNCQVWPGKDYSNPRVQDFYALDKPYEEMYDRTKVPRMPWHDVSMCIVGQPARDVGRHFVQRWNYILRNRVATRPTPVLLPPPEYDQAELEQLGMNGSCTIQILRSCTTWSIGTPNKTECSIMNAYCALIKGSEHFVYIENQFFITSCTVEGTQIQNKIGDALVERAERAHRNGENWRACILIPLMPGFQNTVDSDGGTSIRLIMQCQFRSMCRGETSIFGRLRAQGINPTDYIEFYALRQWGKIGPQKCLTTEQLYIHAKIMVVDDRAAIIGSANINERSMLGSRDSEVAAVVTDSEVTHSFMGGKPWLVGTFPHTLRMRLMREHLGVDVDELHSQERDASEADEREDELERIYNHMDGLETPPHGLTERNLAKGQQYDTTTAGNTDILQDWVSNSAHAEKEHVGAVDGAQDKKAQPNEKQHDLDVAGFGFDNWKGLEPTGDLDGRDSYVNARGQEVMKTPALLDHSRPPRQSHGHHDHHHNSASPDPARQLPPPMPPRMNTRELGLPFLSTLPALPVADDTDIGGPPLNIDWAGNNAHIITPLLQSMSRPMVDDDCMKDPLVDTFYESIWHRVAENNTRLYRQVFRCMPDSAVSSWQEYHQWNTYNEKFMRSQGLGVNQTKKTAEAPKTSGPPGSGATDAVSHVAEKSAGLKGRGLSRGISDLLHRGHSKANMSKTDLINEDKMTEKQRLEQDSRSSAGTRIPSPTVEDEKSALQREDNSAEINGSNLSRSRTVQFPDAESTSQTTRLTAAYANGSTPTPIPTSTSTSPSPDPLMTEKQTNGTNLQHTPSLTRRRRRATTKSRPPVATSNVADAEVLSKEEAEGLMGLVQGHLVLWPYDWLCQEEKEGRWLYNIDQLAPLEIYD